MRALRKRQTAVLGCSIYRAHIKRAAEGTGLAADRWHNRHTFGTILNANGENPKVIQELLRHANLRVTMDTYVQAVSNEKRAAQSGWSDCFRPHWGKSWCKWTFVDARQN
jgi:integrase